MDIVGARSEIAFFNFNFSFIFACFGRFARFGGFVSAVSVVSVVSFRSFRWFRFDRFDSLFRPTAVETGENMTALNVDYIGWIITVLGAIYSNHTFIFD